MPELCTLSFVIERTSEEVPLSSVIPAVNGVRLTKLVEDHDLQAGNQPAGGFGGLVRGSFNFGPWDRYFIADPPNRKIERIGHYLLGCTCGEVTCWPLAARIARQGDLMVWDCFRQPNRPERDYSSFGPFKFKIDQYRQAVLALIAAESR